MLNNKNNKKMVKERELTFLKRELNANKEDILKAISAVGNNRAKIELYLLQNSLTI